MIFLIIVVTALCVVVIVVGWLMDGSEKKGYSKGKKDTTAKYSKQAGKVELRLMENKDHFNAIYAMYAVAVACAGCDGKISTEEREQIEQFITGLSSITMPDHVKEKIKSLYEKPLNIREVFELASGTKLDMSFFDYIINLVIHADGIVHEVEHAFVEAWEKLKAGKTAKAA